jgi:hypothetical protein
MNVAPTVSNNRATSIWYIQSHREWRMRHTDWFLPAAAASAGAGGKPAGENFCCSIGKNDVYFRHGFWSGANRFAAATAAGKVSEKRRSVRLAAEEYRLLLLTRLCNNI